MLFRSAASVVAQAGADREAQGRVPVLPFGQLWRGQGRVVKPFSPPCCSSPCIAALNIPALNRYARNAPVVTTCKCGGEGRVVNAPIPGAHLGLAQHTHTPCPCPPPHFTKSHIRRVATRHELPRTARQRQQHHHHQDHTTLRPMLRWVWAFIMLVQYRLRHGRAHDADDARSEEHTSELQSP